MSTCAGVDRVADEVPGPRRRLDARGFWLYPKSHDPTPPPAGRSASRSARTGMRVLARVPHLRERRDALGDEVIERERAKPLRRLVEARLLARGHRDGRGDARRVAEAVEVPGEARQIDRPPPKNRSSGGLLAAARFLRRACSRWSASRRLSSAARVSAIGVGRGRLTLAKLDNPLYERGQARLRKNVPPRNPMTQEKRGSPEVLADALMRQDLPRRAFRPAAACPPSGSSRRSSGSIVRRCGWRSSSCSG